MTRVVVPGLDYAITIKEPQLLTKRQISFKASGNALLRDCRTGVYPLDRAARLSRRKNLRGQGACALQALDFNSKTGVKHSVINNCA